jgi:hypothetical protein
VELFPYCRNRVLCDAALDVEHPGRAALLRSRSAQFSTLFVNCLIPEMCNDPSRPYDFVQRRDILHL